MIQKQKINIDRVLNQKLSEIYERKVNFPDVDASIVMVTTKTNVVLNCFRITQ